MAIGWINKSSRPSTRRDITETVSARGDVVRSSTFSDGQPRMGTPKENEHRTFELGKSPGYADGKAYRADLRGQTSRGLTGGLEGRGTNPTVHSKNTKRYGRNGSRIDATFKSTGDQPAPQQRDELPPSLPQRTYTERLPPGGISRRVGWLGDGKSFVEADHSATMKRHGSDGVHDHRVSTDNAPGQAHAASGGRFGSPQVRPEPQGRQGVEKEPSGTLNRK